jgi:predicted O-methyltransferase YrrM
VNPVNKKGKRNMTQTDQHPQLPPPLQVLNMAMLNWMIAHAMQVATLYGIADLLQGGPRSVAELASATGTHPDSLYRLLRALATVGVFAETGTEAQGLEERYFAQTLLSQFLCQQVPGSMYAMVRQFASEWEHKSWDELAYSICTGQPAFDHVFGKNAWEYLTVDRPDEGAIFHQAMSSFSRVVDAAIIEAYDFSGIQKLMDVGGGEGTFLLAILSAHPHLQGVLYERAPEATQGAKQLMAQAGMDGRCQVLTGDFLASLPAVGVDACILKHVLHDWDDPTCLTILANCRRVLEPGKKVLIAEQVLPNSDPAPISAFIDLEMLVNSRGRERTEREYRTLLEQSGFVLARVVPTASNDRIVEGIAV